MIFELVWHGPVEDVPYTIEADSEEEAIEQLAIMLCDPDLFPEDV